MRKILILCLSIAIMPMVTACSGSGKDKSEKAQETKPIKPADAMYQEAEKELQEGNYRAAIEKFQEVERVHPYSKWATKAQMNAAYAAYKEDEYDEAILAFDRFIQLHPGNKDVDYAYYIKALSYYEQISDVARDQDMTRQALASFNALISRFPNSKYARDARLKRDLTLDHLAGKEMEIGRYYLNRNQLNAAINRFRTVVKKYQTTTHVPEALHRMVEAYLTLGLRSEAQRIAAVLGHNYPGSDWYARTYKILDDKSRKKIIEDRSFIDKTVDSLLKPD